MLATNWKHFGKCCHPTLSEAGEAEERAAPVRSRHMYHHDAFDQIPRAVPKESQRKAGRIQYAKPIYCLENFPRLVGSACACTHLRQCKSAVGRHQGGAEPSRHPGSGNALLKPKLEIRACAAMQHEVPSFEPRMALLHSMPLQGWQMNSACV